MTANKDSFRAWLGRLLPICGAAAIAVPAADAAPPIYACYVTHIEESPLIQIRDAYLIDRSNLLELAQAISSNEGAYDLQSDWTFLSEVETYDQGDVTADTDGKNLIRYFAENLGVSVDPHAHESRYNIADVAWMISRLAVTPSVVVGGFIYSPPEDANWERFSQPIQGVRFPSSSWTGSLLWGGATQGHKGNDDRSSGIWRPESSHYFYRHNPAGIITQIGGGQRDYEGLLELLACQEAGQLSEGGMYTTSIFLSQQESFTPATRLIVANQISALQTYVDSGRLIWATLPEMADIWRDQYGEESTCYRFRPLAAAASGDYDGDGTADIGVFRPGSGLWAVRGVTRVYFGEENDQPVPGDYDGNGTAEPAIFQDSSGWWSIRGVTGFYFGGASDQPVPGDYAGDGTTGAGIFREGYGLWALRDLTRIYWGGYGDIVEPGYYRGGGTTDIALFRPVSGLWAVRGVTRFYFGSSSDQPVPADYTGDGTPDCGIYRGASSLWAIRGVTRIYFGSSADSSVPGDYTGTGTDSSGIFRGSSGLWAIRGVSRTYFGRTGDIPVVR